MELPVSRTDREGKSRDPRPPAQDHPGHRMEGSEQAMCPVPLTDRERQKANRRCCRDRARARRLHLGDWARDESSDDCLS